MKIGRFGEQSKHTGVVVIFTKNIGNIRLSGWYDGDADIESETTKLREFFDRCGITSKDCEKAFKGE